MKKNDFVTEPILKLIEFLCKTKIDYSFSYKDDFIKYDTEKKLLSAYIGDPNNKKLNRRLRKEIKKLENDN